MGLVIIWKTILVCNRIEELAQAIACQCLVCCIMELRHLKFDGYEMQLECIGDLHY